MMKRSLLILATACVAFWLGSVAHDYQEAHASGGVVSGGSSSTAFPYTGAAAISGSLAITGTLSSTSTATLNGTTIPASATLTKTTDNLSVFAATSSSQLAGVLNDETGTGAACFATGPSLTSPVTINAGTGVALTVTGISNQITESIVGAAGNHSLNVSGPITGAFNAINITDGNGSTTAARFGVFVSNWANTIGGAAIKTVSTGANGDGIIIDTSNANGGYALKLIPQLSSPVFGAVLMTPQNANPTTAGAIGAMYMFTSGYLRVETATTPVWDDVASYSAVVTGITAFATGGQASATLVCNGSGENYTLGTVATAADSVKMPASVVVGKECRIKNKGANSANLFPASGGVLCVDGAVCLAANTATPLAANASITCWAEAATTWNCR